MINYSLTNELRELAAGYVLDDLEPAEVNRVEQLIEDNPAFREEVRQLQGVMGTIATSVPQMQPPAGLHDQIMAAINAPNSSSEMNINQVFVNLGHWLEEVFEPFWESPEALNLAFSTRRTPGLQEALIQRGKAIELGSDNQVQSVVLLMGITAQSHEKVSISIQLHPVSRQRYLPSNLQLTLLSESEEVLRSIEAGPQDNYIKLPRFTINSGVQFSVQIQLHEFTCTENFIV